MFCDEINIGDVFFIDCFRRSVIINDDGTLSEFSYILKNDKEGKYKYLYGMSTHWVVVAKNVLLPHSINGFTFINDVIVKEKNGKRTLFIHSCNLDKSHRLEKINRSPIISAIYKADPVYVCVDVQYDFSPFTSNFHCEDKNKIRVGQTVAIKDGSGAVSIHRNKVDIFYEGTLNGWWNVIATGLENLPSKNGYKNDTVLQEFNGDGIAFTQQRFLTLIS